ncbi:uncharacterized protein LOC108596418 isoform X3 [Drosophila busckii]|uniref:uncharacterized protein LOC108596418 isoform X3 n=1 Tax=Drosophila busckii TaxID=30019 RepID=UPI00083ED07B|nr:uncharacterized protein LOC108596418 isoform X3 [Drosophila busckii]
MDRNNNNLPVHLFDIFGNPLPMPMAPPLPPPALSNDHNNAGNALDMSNNFNYNGAAAAGGHTYMNGVLYNNEFLGAPNTERALNVDPGLGTSEEDSDDYYDPMADDMPPVNGIRFYNPLFYPGGIIPQREPQRVPGHWLPDNPIAMAGAFPNSYQPGVNLTGQREGRDDNKASNPEYPLGYPHQP